jgi:hypothetical protein
MLRSDPTRRPTSVRWLLLAAWCSALAALPLRAVAEEAAAIERRLADSARYLTSDELEGRGVGTKGIDLAADYIARQFEQAGLKVNSFDGKPFQKFMLDSTSDIVSKDNRLTFVGPAQPGAKPQAIELSLGKDFTPLTMSGTAAFDVPLVFAGYGITAKDKGYDDYEGIDVTGKAVVLLRHTPRQDDPKSPFRTTGESPYATMTRKVANAREHGAAAVIFCTDELEIRKQSAETRRKWHEALDRLAAENEKLKKVENPTLVEIEAQRKRMEELLREVEAWSKKLQEECDPMVPSSQGGGRRISPDFPVVHCRRAVLDRAVRAALNTDLEKLEQQIDQGPAPHSRDLAGWRAQGKTDVRTVPVEVKNVVAVLEGEGPAAEETIVIGAHYDHLGYGGRTSFASSVRAVHPGADDNASGTTVLLEIAHALAQRHEKLPRRVVFVAFTGEELGFRGSTHYVEHPLVPLERTVAMLNFDMVGRLRQDKLTVMGTGSAKQFGELLDKLGGVEGLNVNRLSSAGGGSDHVPFFNHNVPVLYFFTGLHGEYHRPADKFETLNVPGMRRIAQLAEDVVVALAKSPARPEFVKAPARSKPPADRPRPFFGCVADPNSNGEGLLVGSVSPGGPAERAGVKAGDLIVELGGSKITTFDDLVSSLGKHKAGERVKTVVRRDGKPVTVEVTLDPAR